MPPQSANAGLQPLSAEGMRFGSPGSYACEYCGAEVAKVLLPCGGGVQVWDYPKHHCEAKTAHQQAQAAADLQARTERLRNPDDKRVAEVFARCHLPCVAPAGLDAVRVQPGYQDLVTQLRSHREQWEAGKRPRKGIWAYGKTNQRKTTSMAAFCFDIGHRTTFPSVFWNFENIMSEKSKLARNRQSRWDQEEAEAAAVLVLDDLGRTTWTAAAYRTLHGLVEHAMSAWGSVGRRQTLYVTSNESPARLTEILNGLPDYEDAGDTLVRRLLQLCDPIQVGPSP